MVKQSKGLWFYPWRLSEGNTSAPYCIQYEDTRVFLFTRKGVLEHGVIVPSTRSVGDKEGTSKPIKITEGDLIEW